jgi:virginiamycin B lyase
MRTPGLLILVTTVLLLSLVRAAPGPLEGQGAASVALSGVVSSAEEGWMEGVVVTARRHGATFTVSVVSNAEGAYGFPRPHLEPGAYDLLIRAVGYDLIRPGGRRSQRTRQPPWI